MDMKFEKYLDTVDKSLKPLPTSERIDIVKEIKSSILEMESEHLSEEQILDRLGDPKDLAKAYLGDLLSKENGFSWNRFLIVCAFYSLVGFSGLIVIPCLAIIAPTFIVCAVISLVLSAIKVIDYIFRLGIPFMDHVGISLPEAMTINPFAEFFITLVIAVLLYLAGRGAWKLLVSYCRQVGKAKSNLAI